MVSGSHHHHHHHQQQQHHHRHDLSPLPLSSPRTRGRRLLAEFSDEDDDTMLSIEVVNKIIFDYFAEIGYTKTDEAMTKESPVSSKEAQGPMERLVTKMQELYKKVYIDLTDSEDDSEDDDYGNGSGGYSGDGCGGGFSPYSDSSDGDVHLTTSSSEVAIASLFGDDSDDGAALDLLLHRKRRQRSKRQQQQQRRRRKRRRRMAGEGADMRDPVGPNGAGAGDNDGSSGSGSGSGSGRSVGTQTLSNHFAHSQAFRERRTFLLPPLPPSETAAAAAEGDAGVMSSRLVDAQIRQLQDSHAANSVKTLLLEDEDDAMLAGLDAGAAAAHMLSVATSPASVLTGHHHHHHHHTGPLMVDMAASAVALDMLIARDTLPVAAGSGQSPVPHGGGEGASSTESGADSTPVDTDPQERGGGSIPGAVEQRLASMERVLKVVRPRISRDVYSRLQALEARVMHLEERGILYVDDSSSSSSSDDDRGSMEGEGMDDHELDERIRMLEESLRRRQTEMKKKKGGGAPC